MNRDGERPWHEVYNDLSWLADHGALSGVAAILAERRRQIEQVGYDANHDSEHPEGWLAADAVIRLAGAAYMARYDSAPREAVPELAQAAALVAAEIDRLTPRRVITDPDEIERILGGKDG